MKKSLFFYAAATALMLTACSSEDDILQTGPEKKVAPQEVGFDVYTQAANDVTRAGLEGTMTTNRLQRSEYEGGGFGVYAYLVEDDINGADATDYVTWMNRTSPTKAPNFMVNEKLLWNATNQGWYYNPLKYWPNETNNDSQEKPATMEGPTPYSTGYNHLDRLTFFAYAPYVSETERYKPGIAYVTNKDGKLALSGSGSFVGSTATDPVGPWGVVLEPTIGYKAAVDNPNEAVDLLWGVAPSGGLTYTAVNGKTVNVKEGEPLIDMTKPNVNTTMKFLFQHALARIGVTAVAAIDQVGAGGTLDPNTKITIEKITLTGYFGEEGFLNLDNSQTNVAKWINVNENNLKTVKFANLNTTTLTLEANHADPIDGQKGSIATHLQWVNDATPGPDPQTNRVGVTTVRQNVIQPAAIDNTAGVNRNWYSMKTYEDNQLAYSETTPYYTNEGCSTPATITLASGTVATISSDGTYTITNADVTLQYPMELKYYSIVDWTPIDASNKEKYASYQAYGGTYFAKKNTAPAVGDKVLDGGIKFIQLNANNLASFAGEQGYTSDDGKTFKPMPVGSNLTADGKTYVIGGTLQKCAPYYAGDTYYKRDANYFMVIPTNNFINANTSGDLSSHEEDLRKVHVMIEYYITTEDSKLANGRAQTKNVIEKDVLFPSIANGKSYNLNLVLGLTSVKMEAEVDDWKVINVQGDLPQNTAD